MTQRIQGLSVLSEANKLRRAGFAGVEPLPFGLRPVKAAMEWGGVPASGSPFARSNLDVTLVLIGGQRLTRDSIARLLADQDGADVLGAFESVASFLAVEMEKSPAVLLLDCDGGCHNTVATLSAHVKSGIVMLCRDMCEEIVSCAIEHRVSGVILKSFSTEDVMAAIRYMAGGRTVMPAGWQRAVAAPMGQRHSLSPRHRQILALIAQGRRNEEIASELQLSPNTIKFHVQALYLRLEVRNRVQAANQYEQIIGDGD
jgi:two-component system, NarL family, response regulator LiaR